MSALDHSASRWLGERVFTAEHARADISMEVDVAIIGAGPSGLVTAAILSEAGARVAIFENGSFWKPSQFQRKQSWALEHLFQDRGARVSQGNAFIPIASGKGVGGGTLVNSGISFRTPDYVLDEWVRTWGLTHWEDRESLFEEVEEMLGVAPTSAAIAGENTWVARRGFEKMQVAHALMPRNTPGCVGCGTCQTGCPVGGKASADLNWLPRALRAGATLYADTRVHEILVESGRAVGLRAEVRDPATRESLAAVNVQAKRVVLAAGSINTALMLLNQKLANTSDQVGRNLRAHPGCAAVAWFDEPIRLWSGATQGYYAQHPEDPEILAETFSTSPDALLTQAGGIGDEAMKFMREFPNMAACGFLIRDSSTGTVRPTSSGPPALRYQINAQDLEKYRKGLAFVTQMFFEAGSRRVRPIVSHARVFHSRSEARQFIRGITSPGRLMLYASHPMGTCRIGDDPKRCVVRPEDGQTWDVENLHIVDSSLMPTSLGVNPQITIMAQSLALSRAMARLG